MKASWRVAALLTCACLAACSKSGDRHRVRAVILVSFDALGARHVGAYGYERDTTPALDALAKQGALFERTWAQQPWTLTSHITMMTGLYVETHGAWGERAARSGATTLAEILRNQGFATAAFTGGGGGPYMSPHYGLGRGFDTYAEGATDLDDGKAIERWLRERATDRDLRFFLFLHYYDIHSDGGTEVPYAAPEPYRYRFLPGRFRGTEGLRWKRRGDTKLLIDLYNEGGADADDREVLRGLYDAEVLHADQMRLAPLLALLGELDLLADTLLIVTSDHGEELFEHGRPIHQQPYQEVAQVPLVVHGPGIPAGARVAAWTELVDLMPTVLDALGLPIPPHVQGESLLPLLRGERPDTACAHVDGRMQGFPDPYPSAIACDIDGVPWTYLDVVTRAAAEPEEGGSHGPYGLRGPGELYRLDRDPSQQTNLALAEPALAARLGRELIYWYGRNEAAGNRLGETSAPVPQPTPAEQERLRALGYAE